MARFICTDIHGNMPVFKKLMAFLKPDDQLFFLGDAMDRGADGWEIMKEMLRDNRITYIKGNHEDMLVQAAEEWFDEDHFGKMCDLVRYNGGSATLDAMFRDPWGADWAKMLKNLPTHLEFENEMSRTLLLSHAGYNPVLNRDDDMIIPGAHKLIWDRNHLLLPWDTEDFPGYVVVHGHTPLQHIAREFGDKDPIAAPLWYGMGHKVCLDYATFVTDQLIVMNADTFDFEVIKGH